MTTAHPLIKNANQYFYEKKYISIHSEDRDITKYPNSSEFEIILPQEYLNVASACLYSWSFPANYNVFSVSYYNVEMVFSFLNIFKFKERPDYDALLALVGKEFTIEIEPGFYNPDQMCIELTNKLNSKVTTLIGFEYIYFQVVYNSVEQKLSFGNQLDQFMINNESSAYANDLLVVTNCFRKNQLPDFAKWGLPSYLGFTRCNATAYDVEEYLTKFPAGNGPVNIDLNRMLPRFFYGDAVPNSGDNGYWLQPVVGLDASDNIIESSPYFLEAPFKISFMGPAYIYMEVDGWNCIDETSPYNLSNYTIHTNNTNGVVNSSFAKIPVSSTPISQWFDSNSASYKYWNPVAERISKLKVKFRYHNGNLVEFGDFEYSFTIELNMLRPQQERSYSIVNAFDLGQQQSLSSKYV